MNKCSGGGFVYQDICKLSANCKLMDYFLDNLNSTFCWCTEKRYLLISKVIIHKSCIKIMKSFFNNFGCPDCFSIQYLFTRDKSMYPVHIIFFFISAKLWTVDRGLGGVSFSFSLSLFASCESLLLVIVQWWCREICKYKTLIHVSLSNTGDC